MDERRLKLTLDGQGNVVDVGSSPEALFGFDPRLLLGQSVVMFLDVFKALAGGPASAAGVSAVSGTMGLAALAGMALAARRASDARQRAINSMLLQLAEK